MSANVLERWSEAVPSCSVGDFDVGPLHGVAIGLDVDLLSLDPEADDAALPLLYPTLET